MRMTHQTIERVPLTDNPEQLCPDLIGQLPEGFKDVALVGLNVVQASMQLAPKPNEAAIREHLEAITEHGSTIASLIAEDLGLSAAMSCACHDYSRGCEHDLPVRAANAGSWLVAGALAGSKIFAGDPAVKNADYSAGGLPWMFRTAQMSVPRQSQQGTQLLLNSYPATSIEAMIRVPSQPDERTALYMGLAARHQSGIIGEESTSLAVSVRTEFDHQNVKIERMSTMGAFVLSTGETNDMPMLYMFAQTVSGLQA